MHLILDLASNHCLEEVRIQSSGYSIFQILGFRVGGCFGNLQELFVSFLNFKLHKLFKFVLMNMILGEGNSLQLILERSKRIDMMCVMYEFDEKIILLKDIPLFLTVMTICNPSLI